MGTGQTSVFAAPLPAYALHGSPSSRLVLALALLQLLPLVRKAGGQRKYFRI